MIQQGFSARDGKQLSFRWFAAENTETAVICLHGSTFSSTRYVMLARLLHMKGVSVCLPDWRGHGDSEGVPGDLDYRNQLQDDLHDLMSYLKERGTKRFILGGHSAGSVVALRYLEVYGDEDIDGFFAIAPPLTRTDETRKYDYSNSGMEYAIRYARKKQTFLLADEAALKHVPKLNMLKYWLALLIPKFRHIGVIQFPAVGVQSANDDRVLEYTFSLLNAYSVKNYPELFQNIKVPCHFLMGEQDEVMDVDTLQTVLKWYVSPYISTRFTCLPKATHMAAISASATPLLNWIKSIQIDGMEDAA